MRSAYACCGRACAHACDAVRGSRRCIHQTVMALAAMCNRCLCPRLSLPLRQETAKTLFGRETRLATGWSRHGKHRYENVPQEAESQVHHTLALSRTVPFAHVKSAGARKTFTVSSHGSSCANEQHRHSPAPRCVRVPHALRLAWDSPHALASFTCGQALASSWMLASPSLPSPPPPTHTPLQWCSD